MTVAGFVILYFSIAGLVGMSWFRILRSRRGDTRDFWWEDFFGAVGGGIIWPLSIYGLGEKP